MTKQKQQELILEIMKELAVERGRLTELFNKMAKLLEDSYSTEREPAKTLTKLEKEAVEYKNHTKPQPLPAKLGIDQLTLTIVGILHENKGVMSLSELHEAVEKRLDTKIDRRNFRNNIMYRAYRLNKKIERVSHGHYRYKQY